MKKEVSQFSTDSVPGFLCVCVHACVLSPAPPLAGQPLQEKPRRWQTQDAGVLFLPLPPGLGLSRFRQHGEKFQYGKPDEEDADAGKDMER